MRVQRTATQSKQPDNLARWLEQVTRVMSGNISFCGSMANPGELLPNGTINRDDSQNMSVWKASGTTPAAANTEFTIAHQLKYVPLTILGQDTNNGGVLYRSTTAWTAKATGQQANTAIPSEVGAGHIYLKCTTASAAYNVIFG